MFFQNVKLLKIPRSRNKVVFQCDETYFKQYGFYNLLSCEETNQDVHIHFINVKTEFIEKVLDLDLRIDLSISEEKFDVDGINFYKLKSYYFCSRYFISEYLFEKDMIDKAYITDADIIFNEKIDLDNINLGVLYYPSYLNNLWKQTGANFLCVSKEKKSFLKKIIDEYNKKLSEIDFDSINESMDKFTKANMYALDQVCMSLSMQTENLENSDFLNLNSVEKFISNKDMTFKIWSLTAKKTENTKQILIDRFKKVF